MDIQRAAATANLSVKNVPAPMLAALRARAARNHRSLQGELMSILEAAVAGQSLATTNTPSVPRSPLDSVDKISIEVLAVRAKQLFPKATESSAELLREMRDGRNS